MADLTNPSVGLDRDTGGTIVGWPHVVQSIGDVFTTRFGERVMREYYGSMVFDLLGEQMNAATIVRFFSAMASAIEQWEPRFRVRKVTPISVDRTGAFFFRLEGEYRPRAVFGDFTVEGGKAVSAGLTDAGGRITIEDTPFASAATSQYVPILL